jgi:hypothetical protein
MFLLVESCGNLGKTSPRARGHAQGAAEVAESGRNEQ